MPGLARTFEPLARQARDEPWPHEDYLIEVLAAEQASRHDSVIRQRLRDARFFEFQVGDESVLAGACDGRAPATGRTRRDESQRPGQPNRLHSKACIVLAWRASPAIC